MIITLGKKEFSEAIHRVSRFAERRAATLPALTGIAIVASDEGIKLRATNLEVGIDLALPGSVKSPGVLLIPSSILREIAGSLSDSGTLTIEHAGDTAVVRTGSGKSTLKTLSAEDFPILPIPDSKEHSFVIASDLLSSLIRSVVSCASTSSVRPELASVYLSSEGGIMKAVASDSFRLAEKKLPAAKSVKPFSMLIPAKNAVDLIETLPSGDITVSMDEHQCAFSWPEGVVTTRLVAANYPDYAQIIPKTAMAEATVLRKDFEIMLKRVAVFSDAFQKVRLGMNPSGKQLTLNAKNGDVGESAESIPASLTGEPIELSFNHRYLAAPLSLITTDNLTLSASGIGRALIMRGAGDAAFLYLVMPMNQ